MSKKVTVFSKPGCLYCDHTKSWLEMYGVEYTEINFMDKSNKDEVSRIRPYFDSGKLKGLPVVEVEGQELFDGYQESLLERYLLTPVASKASEVEECADCVIDFSMFDDIEEPIDEGEILNEELSVEGDLEQYLNTGVTLPTGATHIEFLPVDWVMEYVNGHDYPLTEIGAFTYTRTYSRWIEGKGRREYWHETVKRAIEYNTSLAYSHLKGIGLEPSIERLQDEAKELFINIYNTKQFPSGRTLWLGNGNEKINKNFTSGNFNCAFLNIEEWSDLGDLFYLLLVGTGIGFKSTKTMANSMGKIRTNVAIKHSPYVPVKPSERLEHTQLHDLGNGYIKMYVGDSKEGWVESLNDYLSILTKAEYAHIHTVVFSYNSVRPNGERLKTFGGTASGYEPLRDMFIGIDNVLNNKIDTYLDPILTDDKGYGQVRPIHILDIANLIGNNVIVGGVRRTAQLMLFDADDYEVMLAKYGINGIWTDEQLAQHTKVGKMLDSAGIKPKWFDTINKVGDQRTGLDHRRMSNNSIGFVHKPEEEFLDIVFELMQLEGEPGFVNLGEAARRVLKTLGNHNPTQQEVEAKAYELGLNPCVEVILHSKNVCNLTTINLKSFVTSEGLLDREGLMRAQELSARMGLRMTLVTLELPEWDKIQQRDRLLGVSLTGWKDAMGLLNYTQEQEDELKVALRDVARQSADSYAKELRVNAPMFVTAVKPEGTLSQVAGGVSSGLHWAHSPHYIRRIRINAADPLARVAEELGWSISAEVGTNGKYTVEELALQEQLVSAKTLVIDFPVESGAEVTKDDITIDNQFDNYFSFQGLYTDMNTSNTLTVKPDEWGRAQQRVWDGWESFVGVSFLSHDGGTYTLAPYEAVTKQQYSELKASMLPFDHKLLLKYEQGETETDLGNMDSCSSGVCPIR